jgi:hypothetical protein
MPRVAVCVCTSNRAQLLEWALLPATGWDGARAADAPVKFADSRYGHCRRRLG